jgi:hypothetical protein
MERGWVQDVMLEYDCDGLGSNGNFIDPTPCNIENTGRITDILGLDRMTATRSS